MVLLVDDNAIQLNSRKLILSRAGFDVRIAETPQAALGLLDSELPRLNLVITDHTMPGMSGSEFVREVRKRTHEVPVLVISGLAEAEDEYADLNVSWLAKPCNPEMLIGRVRDLALIELQRTA